MLDKYEFKNYILEENPEEFFSWCLDNKLYKTSEDKKFNSRMRLYYNGEIEFKGVSCVIAFLNKKPIGIVLCEHHDYFENARRYEDTTVAKSRFKIKEQFDWGLQHIGMLNMYIKKNHRKQGLAKTMFQQLEQLRLSSIAKENFEFNPLSVPVFQAKELSHTIAEKYTQYSYVLSHIPQNYCYIYDIHDLSTFLVETRDGEPYPMKNLRARPNFNQQKFSQLDINYFSEFKIENIVSKKKAKII